MTSTQTTVILVNYARPYNTLLQLECFAAQTPRPIIFLWDNNPCGFTWPGADWVVSSNRNLHGQPWRFLLSQVETPYACHFDDDITPADPRLVADATEQAARCKKDQLLGAFGVRLWRGRPYSGSHHVKMPRGDGQPRGKSRKPVRIEVDTVKFRVVFMHQWAYRKMADHYPTHHVDLHISFALAGKRRFHHIASGIFHKRLIELPEGDVGYSAQADHKATRDALVEQWRSQCDPTAKERKPPK